MPELWEESSICVCLSVCGIYSTFQCMLRVYVCSYFSAYLFCVCVWMPVQGVAPAIKGISMSQGRESGFWQSRPVALCLPSIRPVCQPAAPLTHSCLATNLYRVGFTDRVIAALEAEGRGGEEGL